MYPSERQLPCQPPSLPLVISAYLDLEEEELHAIRSLEELRISQEERHARIAEEYRLLQDGHLYYLGLQEQLERIVRQRERWTNALRDEERRLREESIAAFHLAEQRKEEESTRVNAQVAEQLASHIETLWNRNQFVGDFVQVDYGGTQARGLVVERVTQTDYRILFTNGHIHTFADRFFHLTQASDTERDTFRSIGHTLGDL